MALITESALDDWVRGHPADAQTTIVELVKRLVAASCPQPRERRFPLEVGQHGPDGFLDTPAGYAPFVPDGTSYWEIGTGGDAGRKATDDYRDLTATIPDESRHASAFISVTPRSGRREWEYTWKEDAQGAWLTDRRARHDWKDVHLLDGTKLVEWLHDYPAVEFWLAKRFGMATEQIEFLQQRWEDVRSIGAPPPLLPDLFLRNRDSACAKLKDLLEGDVARINFITHYPDHVATFVAAFVESLADERRVEAAGRCLIVSGREAWEAICALRPKHVLVADTKLDLTGDQGVRLIQRARNAGHRIVFGGPRGGVPDPTGVELASPRAHHVKDALEACGYSQERARVLAQQSNGNLSSLRE